MEIKGWHRRFLGNTSSAIWHVDRKMGKDFVTLLDLVKYTNPMVVLPDDQYRMFNSRCEFVYSFLKNMTIEIVNASVLSDADIAQAYKKATSLYFLEYGLYPKETRDFILESSRDIMFSYSILKIRAQNLFPIQIISSDKEGELKELSELLDMPINRVPRDY